MTSSNEIFELWSDSQQDLIQWLAPYMPTCVALYRRIQFGHFTPDSRLLSSINFASPVHQTEANRPWIIAFVDRTCRPETEVWLSASWEHKVLANDSTRLPQEDDLVRSMVREIGKLKTPARSENAAASSVRTNGNGSISNNHFERHLDNENVALFGAVHSSTAEILKSLGFIDPSFIGHDAPYRKYIFDFKNSISSRSLPPGYVYGKVDPKDYELVKSRTQIPRQDRTLCQLPSVAIYYTDSQVSADEPIAWGFLGLDASLTTLHVEPSHRGLGLAKSLSLKLFAGEMKAYGPDDPLVGGIVTHADVATDNVSSQRVCESLGGKWYFEVFWIRVSVV
ncbi:hypothetical protein AUEXF2481DRAFT_26300 [Aureobasidium subglaciale EXF-2481]|uniref:FR47-like domain-containing protein n=1 Tax=Aureobasidium subglaciale (strain EXF-2481) TaxID=1043005 RepID=A0A074YSC4_AURSE|nr:uncharacterized protein AUEXF2481DRAFT_26300 [Aureobasidium subglaciale EXF-2481]KEQ99069.1 hypothetical protein AUEXF2481DRAFT_26300 [Aureobasidium subglaciale EXF-2481]